MPCSGSGLGRDLGVFSRATETVMGVAGSPRESLYSESRLDCEQQPKGTEGRNSRRELRRHSHRGGEGAQQGRSQVSRLPRGPSKELKGVLQI